MAATALSALGIGAAAAQALETGAGSAASSLRSESISCGSARTRRVCWWSRPAAQPDEAPAARAAPETTTPTSAGPQPRKAGCGSIIRAAHRTVFAVASSRCAKMSRCSERRHPLRFVWKMDADGRFVVGSDEFIELVGPRTMAAFGRQWSEIAAELKLDPDDQVTRAVATHETWSGIVIHWPVDGSERTAAGRVVRASGVRSRSQLSRLSRLRRLSRHRPHQSVGACAPRAADRLHAGAGNAASG